MEENEEENVFVTIDTQEEAKLAYLSLLTAKPKDYTTRNFVN